MNTISGVYKITNTVTGDFYIGSSKNVKKRWKDHKCKSRWKNCPNNPMYQDMQKYGLEKFAFEILEEVEAEQLKETEQHFIESLKPTYNDRKAKGWDIERYKEYQKEYMKEYEKTDKYKESKRKYKKSDKGKESNRKYRQSEKGKESQRKASNKYQNQLCCFNGETLTLHALSTRFKRKGIPHPQIEAKKYLI